MWWHRYHSLNLRGLRQPRLRRCHNHRQPNLFLLLNLCLCLRVWPQPRLRRCHNRQQPNLLLRLSLYLRPQLHLPLRHPKHLFLHPQRQPLRPVLLVHRVIKEDGCLLRLKRPVRKCHNPQPRPRKSLQPLVRLSLPCQLRARNQPRELPLLRRQGRLPFARVQALSSISIMQISMK